MILTRIKRGAARTKVLAKNKTVKLQAFRPTLTWQTAEKVVLTAMAVRVAILPTPVSAATAPQVDDTEPPSSSRIAASAASALTFNETGATLSVVIPTLSGIQVGMSVDDAQRADAERRAADEAAAAEAARVKAEEAAKQAALEKAAAAKAAAQKAAETSTTLASVARASYSPEQIRAMIREAGAKYGMSESLIATADRIAGCESGWNQFSKNRTSTASGPFQFLRSTWISNAGAGADVFDAPTHVDVAMRKISRDGTSAWNASKHCWAR